MKPVFSHNSLGSKIFDTINVVFLILFSLCILVPFINLLALSLNEGNDAVRGGVYLLPRKLSFESYKMILENPKILKCALISFLRVIVGTLTSLTVTGLLAYVVTIKGFSGRKLLRILFIITMYFSGGIIPSYLLIIRLGLNNTFTVYWLPYLVNCYYMLIMASYIQELPEAIPESVRMDGGGELRIFFQFIFPMSLPVFAAVALFSAVFHWNAWFDNLIYNSNLKWDTLQIFLRRLLLEVEALQELMSQQLLHQKFQQVTPVTLRAAITIAVTAPIAFIYPFLQKYFISGITLGSVKG
ncbi:MAG: carbohydrate ABC transporter permease [Clostridia bacterium]|nr:carbohydrate ABC transporter permease [Clostridia bacterium]